MENYTNFRISADRPIKSRKDDLLGRSAFANSLASAIKGWKGNDSLVIALYGPWGGGKSSVKNMVRESLHESIDDCPLIIEFNPWQWSGQNQLSHAFFQEIGLGLGKADISKIGKKRAAKWRAYAAYLKAGSFLASGFRSTVFWVFAMIGVFGIGGSFLSAESFRIFAIITGLIFMSLAAVMRWGGAFADTIAAALAASSEVNRQSLQDIKDELGGLLKQLNKPLLVVIDDVDRLSADEIKLLFQLVKANADFPNLVYLLLFQRDIVEQSIEGLAPITGKEFLKKIVQVGFDIPLIERSRLEKILFAALDELLSYEGVGQRFNQQRWGNIFIPGLRPYFTTLRDVHRFLASLSFHVALFRSAGTFEVNPIDLISLEVLRVFEPGVYQRLHAAKSVLTEQRDRSMRGHGAEDEAKQLVESIIAQADGTNQSQVREIIKQLFPPVEWVFGGPNYGSGFEEQWFRELRVCHPDVFDRYFHLTIPEGDISQAELDRILSLVGDRERLVASFRELNKRDLLGVALDRLEAYKQKIELENAVPFVTAFFDIGDELPDKPTGFFEISSEMHTSRIIHWYLKQEKDPTKRGQILKEAMRNTTGFYLPIMNTSIEDSSHERQKDPDAFTVPENDLNELRQICAAKIRQAAESDQLRSHAHLAYILFRWREWASPEEARQWAESLVASNDGLVQFLRAFLQRSTSHGVGDYVSRVHWRMNLKNIEEFVSLDAVRQKVDQIDQTNLSEKEQTAIRTFLKAVKRREQGKPDGDTWHDEDD